MNGSPRAALIGHVRILYEAMQRFDTLASAELGLNLTDLRCVNILREKPLTPGEIGRRVGLSSGSVTALVDRLERRGVVVRTAQPGDRRSSLVSLDDAFRDRAAAVYGILGRMISDALDSEGLQDMAATERLLSTIGAATWNAGDAVATSAAIDPEPDFGPDPR